MLSPKKWASLIVGLPLMVCFGLFMLSGFINGFDEAFKLLFDTPRDLFCSVMPFCDVETETEVLNTAKLWTRIHERAVLDVGKYETREEWRATQRTSLGIASVTHSMRMRATVSVTMGINLESVLPEDIVVDNENETVTVTLPQVQPIECFMADIEYFDRSCVAVCGDLERRLREDAMEDVIKSDGLSEALVGAYAEVQSTVASLIDPLVNEYDIFFVQDLEAPPRLTSSSCD
jgi:hypothetical protein